MLGEILERFAIAAYTPLDAWLLMVVVLLVPTAFLYLVLQKVQKNLASLQGKYGEFVINLGGPAALYGFLLLLGNQYIDKTVEMVPTVRLSGKVQDIFQKPMEGNVWVAAITHKGKVKNDGTFTIRVPYASDGHHELIAYNDWGFVRSESFVAANPEEPREAIIKNFPDPLYTTFVGGPFFDQLDKPINDVEIYVSAQVNPEPLIYGRGDEEATIRIEKGTFKVLFRKSDTKKIIWSRDFSNVAPGSFFRINPQVNVNTQLSQVE